MNLFGSVTDWSPLWVSLRVASLAGIVSLILGTGLAWLLVNVSFKGKWIVEGLTLLSLVLPPTVLGYYLLVFLGRQGIGVWLQQTWSIRFVFALPGAVVAATIASLPLVVQTTQTSLGNIDREIEEAGRVDGCNEWLVFWRISLPLAWRGVVAGGLLGFLRALGDFGATLMVAGNIPGQTQTLSMAIYDAVQANNTGLAASLVLLLTSIAFGLIFAAQRLNQRVFRTR